MTHFLYDSPLPWERQAMDALDAVRDAVDALITAALDGRPDPLDALVWLWYHARDVPDDVRAEAVTIVKGWLTREERDVYVIWRDGEAAGKLARVMAEKHALGGLPA